MFPTTFSAAAAALVSFKAGFQKLHALHRAWSSSLFMRLIATTFHNYRLNLLNHLSIKNLGHQKYPCSLCHVPTTHLHCRSCCVWPLTWHGIEKHLCAAGRAGTHGCMAQELTTQCSAWLLLHTPVISMRQQHVGTV